MNPKYQAYLLSPEWKAKRELVFKKQGKRCRECETTKGLHVHHLTYERIFNERVSDLIVLCEKHHRYIHNRYKWWERLLLWLRNAIVFGLSVVVLYVLLHNYLKENHE